MYTPDCKTFQPKFVPRYSRVIAAHLDIKFLGRNLSFQKVEAEKSSPPTPRQKPGAKDPERQERV